MFTRIRKTLKLLRLADLRFGWWPCSACGKSLQVRINGDEMGVRCVGCGASPVTQSFISVVRDECPNLAALSVFEMSSRGGVVDWLRRASGMLTTSEFMPDVPLGETWHGVRCEDVQRLTFADASFDVCTSTEVFEHVENDRLGFSEVYRVLKAAGRFLFTVPLFDTPKTVERVSRVDGRLVHVLPAEYHDDPFSGSNRVLCMRHYGHDIVARLHAAGFSKVELVRPKHDMMHCARTVIVATKQSI